MARVFNNRTVISAIIISVTIIIVSMAALVIAENAIMNSGNYSAKERAAILAEEVLAQYESRYDTRTDIVYTAYTYFNEDNGGSIIVISGCGNDEEIIEAIYVNLNRIDMHETIKGFSEVFDEIFGVSTTEYLRPFFNSHDIDWENTNLSKIDMELFDELIEMIAEKTGVQI